MITESTKICPKCGGPLKHIGRVKRKVKTNRGETYTIMLKRFKCKRCEMVHRELPSHLLPYKHYEKNIIEGFINGYLSSYDLDYEDYPCESTIKKWGKSRKNHFI